MMGASSDFPDAQWYIVDKFQGYATKADPTKLPVGANPNGQNVTVNDGDKISIRNEGTEDETVGDLENFKVVRDQLCVLARSSPDDKYLMATGLKKLAPV